MPFDPKTCYSHSNGNLLSDHLFYVGKTLFHNFPNKRNIAFLTGIFHDFGKLTSYYQKYIQAKMEDKEALDISPVDKTHTGISIFFSAYFFNQYLSQNDYHYIIPIISALNHHSRLIDFEHLLRKLLSSKKSKVISKQVDDLANRLAVVNKLYKTEIVKRIQKVIPADSQEKLSDTIEHIDFADFLQKASNPRQIIIPIYHYFKKEYDKSIQLSVFNMTLYGNLINADRKLAKKLPAAYCQIKHFNNRLQNLKIPQDIVENFVKNKYGYKDKYKTKLFRTVEHKILSNTAKNYKIFNISAPTGSGKTETALNAAFKLLQNSSAERIIYALPLTNLLDQNYHRIKRIFSQYIPQYSNFPNDYLLGYHYCAEYDFTNNNEESTELLEKAENFHSKFIITTYVQLLYTLVSNNPGFLFRQSELKRAIIILDEPQVLNPEHHQLINQALYAILQNFESKLILMTATDPLLFTDDKYLDLTADIDHKNHIKNRTQIVPCLDISTKAELVSFIKDNLLGFNSILIVLNTIKSSIELFKELCKKGFFFQYQIYYLSTNLIPAHRDEIIEKIEEHLQNGENIILVSTQVIEAGIDFDFNIGIRDIAPFDSLVQTAGRVNRKGQFEKSSLYISQLKHEKTGNKLASYIYDPNYLNFTHQILDKYTAIPETYYNQLTKQYFHLIKAYLKDYDQVQNEQNPFYNLLNFKFDEMDNNFNIIDEKYYEFPLILPFDNVTQILENYEDLVQRLQESNYEEKWKLRQKLKLLRRQFYPYIVNVSNSSFPLLKDYIIPEEDNPLNWAQVIDKNFLSDIYDYAKDTKIGQGININSEVEALWI